MDAAREEIAFLARSENRVAVLSTLDTEPLGRAELQQQAAVERVTLGRILSDFEDRGWVRKTGREYALTPTGEMIVGDFEQLLTTVTAAQKLDSVVQWLPTEEMPFDLRHLGSADITLPIKPTPRHRHDERANASRPPKTSASLCRSSSQRSLRHVGLLPSMVTNSSRPYSLPMS